MSNKVKYILLSACGFLVVVIIALVIIESMGQNKIVIKNKSGVDITSMVVEFYNFEEDQEYGSLFDGSISNGETVSKKIETVDFGNSYAECLFTVTFADGSVYQDCDGIFQDKFPGKMTFEFYKNENDEIMLKTFAGIGLFGSTDNTSMDSDICLDEDDEDYLDLDELLGGDDEDSDFTVLDGHELSNYNELDFSEE